MEGLQSFAARNDQNVNPNIAIVKENGQLIHKQIGNDFEAQSIRTD